MGVGAETSGELTGRNSDEERKGSSEEVVGMAEKVGRLALRGMSIATGEGVTGGVYHDGRAAVGAATGAMGVATGATETGAAARGTWVETGAS